MYKLVRVLPSVTILLFLAGNLAVAQDEDLEPLDRQAILSGGSTAPDMDATLPGPSSLTGTKRPPRVGPNVRVNGPQQSFPNGLLGRSETTVAATDDGQLVLAGFNDAQGFCGPPFNVACTPESPPGLSGFGFSTDGGLTFTDGGAPDPALFNNVFTRGDPWMDRGGFDDSTFYYANLAVRADIPCAPNCVDLGVSVHRGHFSGSGFAFEDVRTFNAPNAPNDFYDKDAIAAAKDGSGAAYVSLTNFIQTCGVPQNGFGQIEVWRTHDAGDTWQGPVVVSPDQTDITDPSNSACGQGGILQQSSAPGIGPNGQVYVAWQLGPHLGPTSTNAAIVVARSLDGGVSFGAPVTVANINSMRQNPLVGYNRSRINDHPRIAVATTGSNTGRVYVVFYRAASPVGAAPTVPCPAGVTNSVCIGQNLVSSQAFISHSDDKGLTWSTPVPVAPAEPATGVKRIWPVVSVEPGGSIDVVYYESQEMPTSSNPTCTVRVATLANGKAVRRTGPANSLVDTFWAQSLDGGATFSAPVKVTTATSNWCTAVSNIRPNFGDYIGSASGGNRVFPVWADGRNGVPDTFSAQILAAGKSQ